MQAAKFSLEGSVGVAQVEQLHASVQEAVQGDQAVELDLSEVRDIDGSILQLILATEAATTERGIDFALTGLSDSLQEMLTFNGAKATLANVRAESPSETVDEGNELAADSLPVEADEGNAAGCADQQSTDEQSSADAPLHASGIEDLPATEETST